MKFTYVMKFKDTGLFRNEDDGTIFKIPLSEICKLSPALRAGCSGHIVPDPARRRYKVIFDTEETETASGHESSGNKDLQELEGNSVTVSEGIVTDAPQSN